MDKKIPTTVPLEQETIQLRARLAEAEQTLQAIRSGEVDALVVSTAHGTRVFALEDAAQPFRLLVENMGEGALTMTREGTILYANRRFAQMLQRPLKKLIGSGLHNLVAATDQEKLQTLLAQDHSSRCPAALDLVSEGGSPVPVQISLINLHIDGAPDIICAVVTDLTELKQHEKDLQESEARYRSLVENAGDAIIVLQAGYIKYANPRARKLFACPPKKAAGLTVPLSDATSAPAGPALDSVSAPAGLSFSSDPALDAPPFPADPALAAPSSDSAAGLAVPFSDFAAAPAAPSFGAATAFAATSSVSDPALAVPPAFGAPPPATAPVLPFIQYVHPEDRHFIPERSQKRHRGERLEHPFLYRVIDSNGEVKFISESSVKINWAGQPALLAIMTDITEHKVMEEEIFKAGKLESIGILAGGIAHDFNNFLAVMQLSINMAQMYAGNTEKVAEKLANMERAVQRAVMLSNQLFTFAQGGAPLREKISLQPLITNDFKFALSGSAVSPDIVMDAALYMVEADAGQLNQVFSNLAINAAQAMPDGGTLAVRAENVIVGAGGGNVPAVLPPGPYVKITVRDTGTGIPVKHLPKIFDPFFSTKDRGRGLGLATTYSIIKKHGGWISVESEPGVGTSFTIFLPAVDTVAKQQPASAVTVPGTGKVLLMDDQEELLHTMENSLAALGYTVASSRNGAEALKLYTRAKEEKQPFDLVVLDLTIPGGMGGKQTMQELLRLDPAVKAIVASGYSRDPVMAHYQDFGFQGMLKKPFTTAELSQAVSAVLGEKKQ